MWVGDGYEALEDYPKEGESGLREREFNFSQGGKENA